MSSRIGKQSTVDDSRAFYEFQDRRGRVSGPVLLCCWLTAVGAGLLKSEEILEGMARLRLSNNIEFKEQNFISMMNEAREKRAKLNAPAPTFPMVLRVEKAFDAISVCYFGRYPVEEEYQELLTIMLCAIFPSVDSPQIQLMIKEKARRVAEGTFICGLISSFNTTRVNDILSITNGHDDPSIIATVGLWKKKRATASFHFESERTSVTVYINRFL